MFDKSVRERDLDHFLLEELSASRDFLDYLLGKVSSVFSVPPQSTVHVQRSPRRLTDNRQTDLQISFVNHEEITGVVVIENKVTDGFQDGQPEAYGEEIAAWQERVGQEHAIAVLVSPRSNLAVQGREHFHAVIHVEEIVDHLAARLKDGILSVELRARLKIKIELLEAICGKRANSRWNPEPIPERLEFHRLYELMLRELAPELRVKSSGNGIKSNTRFFDNFPGQRELPFSPELKLAFGHRKLEEHATLQFKRAGDLVEAVRAADGLVPQDGSIRVEKSGTSLMVRVVIPGTDPDPARFEEQREKLIAGINAVKLLCEWLLRHKGTLAEIMKKS